MVAFCSVKKLDAGSGKGQSIVLVLRESCAKLEDKTVYRYHIHDEFLWGYGKCRIQLKAMMRICYVKHGITVPIFRVSPDVLKRISEGEVIPRPYYRNSSRIRADLEDYALSRRESAKTKDPDELPVVMEYIDAFKLEHVEEDGIYNPRHTQAALCFTQ